MVTADEKKFYDENGYLILRNLIPKSSIENVMQTIENAIRLEVNQKNDKDLAGDDYLNEILIKLKHKYPYSSSWIYETINRSFTFAQFVINAPYTESVLRLLDVKSENYLGIISPTLRMDIPGDKKNIREWHQDSNYFLETESGDNSLVVWTPLNEAYSDNGSVILCPGSHKRGRMNSLHTKSGELVSEQYITPEEYIKSFEQITIEAEAGDVAFIHMDLIHRSGVNITNSVRYTSQIRYANFADPTYRPVRLIPQYQEYKRSENLEIAKARV